MTNTIVQNPIGIQRSKETASDWKNQSEDVGGIQTRKDKSRRETKWIWNKEGWEVNSSENITIVSQKKKNDGSRTWNSILYRRRL